MYESLILFTILHVICLCGSTYLPTIMCNGEMSLLRGIIFYDIVLRKIFTLFYWERLKTFWFWNMQNSPVHLLHVVLKSLYSRWIIVIEKFFFLLWKYIILQSENSYKMYYTIHWGKWYRFLKHGQLLCEWEI